MFPMYGHTTLQNDMLMRQFEHPTFNEGCQKHVISYIAVMLLTTHSLAPCGKQVLFI